MSSLQSAGQKAPTAQHEAQILKQYREKFPETLSFAESGNATLNQRLTEFELEKVLMQTHSLKVRNTRLPSFS